MAKVLISSVGTGNIIKDSDADYKETVYRIKDEKTGELICYSETLMAKVLLDHYNIEKVLFIGTGGSMWDNIYYKFDGEDVAALDQLSSKKADKSLKLSDLDAVTDCLNSYLKTDGSKCFLISYTENTVDEMWSNFENLLEVQNFLEDGDEIILDITHGFRYMPILNIFLINTMMSMQKKQFEIKAVLYGMLADEYSDIIDFKIFFDLMEWIKAINAFKNHNDAHQLSLLLGSADESAKPASKVLMQMSENIQMVNMQAMWGFMKGITKKVQALKNSNNKIINLLSGDLLELAARLDKEVQSAFQYELALWLHENNNYALSYIVLYEAVITRSCELSNTDVNDHAAREDAKKSIGHDKYGKYFYTNRPDSLSVIRNSIVHQNSERKDKVKQDIEKLKTFLDHFESYFDRK